MKSLLFCFICLFLTISIPMYSQPTDVTDNNNAEKPLSLSLSTAISYTPSCSKEKLGLSYGIDSEWCFLPWMGAGIGTSFMSESASWEDCGLSSDNIMVYWKTDQRLGTINFPLRLYLHPARWLTIDAGIQLSHVVSGSRIKGLSRTCWSVPFGMSFGKKYRFFFRYQPRLGDMMKSGENGRIKCDMLLFGFGIGL